MKRQHLLLSITVLLAAVLQTLDTVRFEVTGVQAQASDRCLGNEGSWTVKPGDSYTDSRGVWVCAPGHPESTAGGWVLIKPTPTPIPEPSATPTPPRAPPLLDPAEPASAGFPLVWILAPGGLLAGLGAALGVRWLIVRERLTGSIVIEEEDRHG